MKTSERVKQTKDKGIKVACKLETKNGLSIPLAFIKYPKAYFHFDTSEADYSNKICKVWISKAMTSPNIIQQIRTDPDLKKENETGE